jgi:IclR family pca regulon transcriptional regulator
MYATKGRRFPYARVLELGYPYLVNLSLPEVGRPFVEGLVVKVRESSSIAVLDGGEIVYVAHGPRGR